MKKCPFCGEKSEYHEYIGKNLKIYSVKCKCGACITGKSKDDVIEKWNMREIQNERNIYTKMIKLLNEPDVKIVRTKIDGYMILVTTEEEGEILHRLWEEYIEGTENDGKID